MCCSPSAKIVSLHYQSPHKNIGMSCSCSSPGVSELLVTVYHILLSRADLTSTPVDEMEEGQAKGRKIMDMEYHNLYANKKHNRETLYSIVTKA